jgi:hypothetical protein
VDTSLVQTKINAPHLIGHCKVFIWLPTVKVNPTPRVFSLPRYLPALQCLAFSADILLGFRAGLMPFAPAGSLHLPLLFDYCPMPGSSQMELIAILYASVMCFCLLESCSARNDLNSAPSATCPPQPVANLCTAKVLYLLGLVLYLHQEPFLTYTSPPDRSKHSFLTSQNTLFVLLLGCLTKFKCKWHVEYISYIGYSYSYKRSFVCVCVTSAWTLTYSTTQAMPQSVFIIYFSDRILWKDIPPLLLSL